ncbi:hypothetical protein KXD40_001656 [Peronospora effusa]|uniref:Rad52/22 double-strand break repair protein n=1 Tax=Peronospora effusa TaxID=542832 RepID=A0A3M6VSP5_9STRA|nr:hypothetical protein DD238_001504 [Peronospora effusa]RQM17142.1 hypothetical protein DD237_001910 [Peronospora effusa]UIZ26376.1 hypothetical protein KXD40_001656 [Peronospora effusa]CAI5712540.1 unnamed protein product [Peronospora effusa]
MKRRLSEMMDVKSEPNSDMEQTMVMLVAQKVAMELLASLNGDSSTRFGRVAFADQEKQSVNAFLHQKLGKDSLARRPGPGGRKLTYIESCKAIELANRAFGFNGWSCHIVECKEEFKEKKGDRWSIAYSSLVRIELKDGTSHEDVGFGSSDGQRDLGAALEQAKKASISDARKRALRLFGEYLGNSCYDREHIKDVNSNKTMAPLAAAPNVILPGQQMQGGVPRQPVVDGQSTAQNRQVLNPQQNQQLRPQQPLPQHPQVQQPPRQQMPPLQSAQQHQQHQQMQQQQWKPPQVMRNQLTAKENASVQQPAPVISRPTTTIQTTATNNMSATHHPSTSTAALSSSTSAFRPQPQRKVSSNAPPPPRMMASNYQSTIVKSEQPPTGQAYPNAQYDMEDLSLSQFDYDPNAGNSNVAKKMRS